MGIDRASLPPGATLELIFTHAPKSWQVFVMLAAGGGILYAVFRGYRRENATCPLRIRMLLAGLRGLIVILLFLIALGPALAVSLRKTSEPYIIILLDDSLSMSIRDRYNKKNRRKIATLLERSPADIEKQPPSRAELISWIMQKNNGEFLRKLRQKGQVRIFTFSDKARLRNVVGQRLDNTAETSDGNPLIASGEPVPPLTAAGVATNLARGLRTALKSAAGQPVSALILISDGQNTSGDDPLRMAKRAALADTPIFTVGVGDSHEPRNLTVAEILAPESAYRKDPLVVQALLKTRGLSDVEVSVELLARPIGTTADQSSRVVASQQLRLKPETREQRVTFKVAAKVAGKFLYTVRIPVQPGELLSQDNTRSTVVNVLDSKARVLLIAGSPTWDYRLLKNLLIRDETINVSCWLQSMDSDLRQEGNTVIDRLPDQPAALFKYDEVIFIDPDPAEFNSAWIEALKKFCSDHAGGLLWMAGPKNTLRFFSLPQTEGIRELLPVKTNNLEANLIKSIGALYTREWPLHICADGLDHPLLQIAKDPQVNKRLWASLPGVYWSFPVSASKPATRLLLEHSAPYLRGETSGRPLLVTGHYGLGRTIYMGFNGTWRWRRSGAYYFDRFWIQTVRYLLDGRLSSGRRRGRIDTNRDTYSFGDQVAITATLYDAQYQPLTQEKVTVYHHVQGGRVTPLELKLLPKRGGVYVGELTARHLGLNELKLTFSGAGDEKLVQLTRQFTVEVPNIEYADPRLNEALLTSLAAAAGGSYFAITNTDDLLKAVPDRRETIITQDKPRSLWDNSRVLFLLVGLLTLEWILRKRFRLL